MIVAAARNDGLPYIHLELEGEQHGFRIAETVVRCVEAELVFYGQVLGFDVLTRQSWADTPTKLGEK